eukprot:scaffold4097_cov166-Amphora_coffeaeformis.AAC.45
MADRSSLRRLLCVSWISSLSCYASACSLDECLNGTVLASAPPIDTTLTLTFPMNETCSNVSLPLRCAGCASCDSNYILEWPDSDSYNCSVDELYSRAPGGLESISCSRLVFGDLTQGDGDGHCGWAEASGRGTCRYADSQLMGGTRVCRNSNAEEGTSVAETSLVLRKVVYQCVSPISEVPTPSPSNDTVRNSLALVPTVVPTAELMDNDTDLPSAPPTVDIPRSLTSSSPKRSAVWTASFMRTKLAQKEYD